MVISSYSCDASLFANPSAVTEKSVGFVLVISSFALNVTDIFVRGLVPPAVS